MTKRKFTDGELRGLHAEGLNDVEIAEELGVHPSTVSERRNKLRLEPNHPRKKWARKRILERLRELHRELGRSPLYKDDPAPFQAFRRYGYFDTADDARDAAGVPTLSGKSVRPPRTSEHSAEQLRTLVAEASEELGTRESVEKDALELLDRYEREKKTLWGMSLERYAAAALLVACRRAGRAVTLEEAADAVNARGREGAKRLEGRDVSRTARKILREIGEHPPRPAPLEAVVEKCAEELQLSRADREKVVELARELAGKLNISGRPRRTLAAALIYAHAISPRSKRRLTQWEVAEACDTSEPALRQNVEWISERVGESSELSRLFAPKKGGDHGEV